MQVFEWLNATRDGAPVCYPCFLKPDSHAGGSVGVGTYHIWKGSIHNRHHLVNKARKLYHLMPGANLILERSLQVRPHTQG